MRSPTPGLRKAEPWDTWHDAIEWPDNSAKFRLASESFGSSVDFSSMTKAKRKKHRSTRKSKMTWPTTPRGWLSRWRHSMKVIRDKATDLWADRMVHKEWLATVLENPELEKGNELFWFMERSYASHILVSLRTFGDDDLRAHSLFNLIDELADHHEILTREWFVARWSMDDKAIAHRQFDRDWGKGRGVSRRRLEHDARTLERALSRIKRTVDQRIAHVDRKKHRDVSTMKDIDRALDEMYRLVRRYHALIFNADWGEPILLPWTHILDMPWRKPFTLPRAP